MRPTRTAVGLAYALVPLWLSCATHELPVTEIVVVIDSDLRVPDQLDLIHVDLTTPDSQPREAEQDLVNDKQLPLRLGIVHAGGGLTGMLVVATGTVGGRNVIRRRARVDFIPKRTVILHLDLLAACANHGCPSNYSCGPVSCGDGGSCDAVDCLPVPVPASQLALWTGPTPLHLLIAAPAPHDGGPPSSDGALSPGPDSSVTPGMGDAGTSCTWDGGAPCNAPTANGTGSCVNGHCALQCRPGFTDCDGDPRTGCEANLASPQTCGTCSVGCDGTKPLCQGAPTQGFRCVSTCASGATLCGGGCVLTSSDPQHCGGCDTPCKQAPNAVSSCQGGQCQPSTCLTGFADCNTKATDGCEVDLLTDVMHCKSCSNACTPADSSVLGLACKQATCTITSCSRDRADCNLLASDGCEVTLSSDEGHCGSCARQCRKGELCCSGQCQSQGGSHGGGGGGGGCQ